MGFGKQLLDGLKSGFTSAVTGLPGGAIGFGTSYLSGLVNQGFERKSLDYQAQLNEQAALNAYNRQLDFWNKQNAYNDPSSQMARLIRAGLNPALINANGVNNTAGTLSSVPQSSPGSPGGNKVNPSQELTALMTSAVSAKQMGFLDAQTNEAIQRTLSIVVDRELKKIEKQLKLTEAEKLELDYEEMYEALFDKGIDGGPTRIKNNRYSEEIRAVRASALADEAHAAKLKADEEYTLALERYTNDKNDREAAEHLAHVAAIKAQTSMYYAQAAATKNQDKREAARLEMDREIHQQLKDLNASQQQVAEAEAWLAELWRKPSRELVDPETGYTRWNVFQDRWRDFIHHNLRLSGSASATKK